jgi:hypothetical protein
VSGRPLAAKESRVGMICAPTLVAVVADQSIQRRRVIQRSVSSVNNPAGKNTRLGGKEAL